MANRNTVGLGLDVRFLSRNLLSTTTFSLDLRPRPALLMQDTGHGSPEGYILLGISLGPSWLLDGGYALHDMPTMHQRGRRICTACALRKECHTTYKWPLPLKLCYEILYTRISFLRLVTMIRLLGCRLVAATYIAFLGLFASRPTIVQYGLDAEGGNAHITIHVPTGNTISARMIELLDSALLLYFSLRQWRCVEPHLEVLYFLLHPLVRVSALIERIEC